MKQILVRLDEDLVRELKQAGLDEDLTMTDLIEQGVILRLRMPNKSKLPQVLKKLGYKPRTKPGRPRSEPDYLGELMSRGAVNGHVPAGVAAGAPDGWELDD